jgi:DNA-binding CsgD family transcriptional regulator
LASPFKSKIRLEAENAVLRHQLTVFAPRTMEHGTSRMFLLLESVVPSGNVATLKAVKALLVRKVELDGQS